MKELSFKEKTLNNLFLAAFKYSLLLNKEVIIRFGSLNKKKEYIIRFYNNNYQHLTGVKTNLVQEDFFNKCLSRTLKSNEYDCNSTTGLKEIVRKKLRHLIHIDLFFKNDVLVQERFEKGYIKCLLASTDGKCTIGFDKGKNYLRPKTILNKNKLNYKKPIYKVKPEIHVITIK